MEESRINDIMSSLDGIKRAQPDAMLFDKIIADLDRPTAKIVSMAQWRWVAAAAVAVLVLNFIGIKQYSNAQNNYYTQQTVAQTEDADQLISNFNLYE